MRTQTKAPMACPHCRSRWGGVLNSRPTHGGYRTWRRHQCSECGKRWTTIEAPTCEIPGPSETELAACLGRWLYQHDVMTMGVKAVRETA